MTRYLVASLFLMGSNALSAQELHLMCDVAGEVDDEQHEAKIRFDIDLDSKKVTQTIMGGEGAGKIVTYRFKSADESRIILSIGGGQSKYIDRVSGQFVMHAKTKSGEDAEILGTCSAFAPKANIF